MPMEADDETYCFCNSQQNDRNMIQCSRCSSWYHHSCVQITEAEALLITAFCCPLCAAASARNRTRYLPEHAQFVLKRDAEYRELQTTFVENPQARFSPAWFRMLMERYNSPSGAIKDWPCPTFRNASSIDVWRDLMVDDGFRGVYIFEDVAGLGFVLPGSSFTVNDVVNLLGGELVVQVFDVPSQRVYSEMWSLDAYAQYMMTPPHMRTAVLNMISLEFSGTKMDDVVIPPQIVREVDWLDNVWPSALKERHLRAYYRTSGSSAVRLPKFPKVQKYCLISAAGSYTDFHIDFGGSSVWYHVLRGEKVFFLVPPTEVNMKRYEAWYLSKIAADRSHPEEFRSFFGLIATDCYVVRLQPGQTLLISSGWIHAVWTPKDSLVFGGNFMHSVQSPLQWKTYENEIATKISVEYRFPHFELLYWYFLRVVVTELDHSSVGARADTSMPDSSTSESLSKKRRIMSNANGSEPTSTLPAILVHLIPDARGHHISVKLFCDFDVLRPPRSAVQRAFDAFYRQWGGGLWRPPFSKRQLVFPDLSPSHSLYKVLAPITVHDIYEVVQKLSESLQDLQKRNLSQAASAGNEDIAMNTASPTSCDGFTVDQQASLLLRANAHLERLGCS